MRVKVTGYLDLDDQYADPDHKSGVSIAGWDTVADDFGIGDLEDLEVESV